MSRAVLHDENALTQSTFCHEVAFYGDEEEFLSTTAPYIRRGLEAEEPMLVAVGRSKIDLIEGELGGDADDVHLVDMAELGRNPARIIPAWREFLELNLRPGGSARGIGEPIWPGRSEAELDECQRHESLLNVAFGGGPGWSLLCPYDTQRLDDAVLQIARENHPYLYCEGANGPCAEWRDLQGFSPFAGSLAPPAADARSLHFDRDRLGTARALAREEAERAALSQERAADIAIAVGELAANSVRHGGGEGDLRVWLEPGALVVEVEDEGFMEDPMVGRVRPDPSSEGGRGLWMANQLCDLVQIRSETGSSTVRLWMSLV